MRLRISIASGFTLVECMIAVALSALFLGSVFTMSVSSMDAIRCSKEYTAAGQVPEQRLESLRHPNCLEVTSADWVAATLLIT